MSAPMKTALFNIYGRYGSNNWAVARVTADLIWNKLSLDYEDLPKNSCVYQIGEFAIYRPDGRVSRVNIRANVITECIDEIAKSGKLTAKGAIKTLYKLRDGR